MNKSMILASLVFLGLSNAVYADDAKKDEIICTKNDVLKKTMEEKGYSILLNMTNSDNVIETIWVGGTTVIITAAVPKQDNSCLLATLNNVIYNPLAIEGIWNNYKKQTKQKDI